MTMHEPVRNRKHESLAYQSIEVGFPQNTLSVNVQSECKDKYFDDELCANPGEKQMALDLAKM